MAPSPSQDRTSGRVDEVIPDFWTWWADHWPLIPVIILFIPVIWNDGTVMLYVIRQRLKRRRLP